MANSPIALEIIWPTAASSPRPCSITFTASSVQATRDLSSLEEIRHARKDPSSSNRISRGSQRANFRHADAEIPALRSATCTPVLSIKFWTSTRSPEYRSNCTNVCHPESRLQMSDVRRFIWIDVRVLDKLFSAWAQRQQPEQPHPHAENSASPRKMPLDSKTHSNIPRLPLQFSHT